MELFFSSPCFHFFLAVDRGHDGAVALEVDEAGYVVLCGEAFECVGFVLEDPLLDVAGHADVEHAALVGEDVDVVELRHWFSMRVAVESAQ